MKTGTNQALTPQERQGVTLQINLPELVADIRASVGLTSRLITSGYALLEGADVWSHDDLNFLERVVIRGAREFRLREFNQLLDEIQVFAAGFQEKADQAAAVLMAFGETVPVPQRSLAEVDIDTDTSTNNHEWPGNLQDSISSLVAYLQDIDRLRDEYWLSLERVSQRA
jgi:hypothetical protein